MDSHELRFKLGLTIFEDDRDHFCQVRAKLIERFSLRVSAGEAGDIPNVQSPAPTSIHDSNNPLALGALQ